MVKVLFCSPLAREHTLEFGRAAPYFLARRERLGGSGREAGPCFLGSNFDGKKCHESLKTWFYGQLKAFLGDTRFFGFESTGSTISKYRVPIAVFDYQVIWIRHPESTRPKFWRL